MTRADTPPPTTAPRQLAREVLVLTPLLLLTLAPWLGERSAARLLTPVTALPLFAAVLAGAVAADQLRGGRAWRVLLGGALAVMGSLVAAVVAPIGDDGSTLRVVAGVLVVAGAVLVFFDLVAPATPLVLVAVLVVAALVAGPRVTDAVEDDEEIDRVADQLVAAGLGAAYLPRVDGLDPESAVLADGEVTIFYDSGTSMDGRGIGTGYLQLSRADLCENVGSSLQDGCRETSDEVGAAGDSQVARRQDDGTIVVFTAGDNSGSVTRAEVDDLEDLQPRPVRELAELIHDS